MSSYPLKTPEEIKKLKKLFYNSDNELQFYKSQRYYYDWLCHEYKTMDTEDKLDHLGFLVYQGFNLHKSIREYKKERERYIIDAIKGTFIHYVNYMRFSDIIHFTTEFLEKLSEKQIIQLFIDEVKLRYVDQYFKVVITEWTDDEVLEVVKDYDKATFNKMIASTELTTKLLKDDIWSYL